MAPGPAEQGQRVLAVHPGTGSRRKGLFVVGTMMRLGEPLLQATARGTGLAPR